MKKLFTFLASAALLGAMTACSSDEPAKGQPDNPQMKGDGAYLSVKIINAESTSRTTTSPGFQDSDSEAWKDGFENEHKVKYAKFFFFDEKGIFVCEGNAIDPVNGEEIEFDKESTDNNTIEYINKDNVVVLRQLTESDKYPSYMLTVLNAPEFTAGNNLSETVSALANYYNKLTKKGTEPEANDETTPASDFSNFFVMSTSSYSLTEKDGHQDAVNGQPSYFATYIPQEKYKTSPEDAKKDANAVNVYVERLAAKAEIAIAPATEQETKTIGGVTYYKLTKATISGGNNVNDKDDPTQIGTDVYLRVIGWNLNATVPDSYMFKNINTGWTFNWGSNGSWNDANNFRSYWGMSTVYGSQPSNLTYRYNTDLKVNDDELKSVIYNDYTNMCAFGAEGRTKTKNDFAYCNENTNLPQYIFGNYTAPTEGSNVEPDNSKAAVDSRYVTHAVVFGQICNDKGQGLDLVRGENGVLYQKNEYLKFIINRINDAQNKLNLWVKTTTSENQVDYVQVGTSVFKLGPIENSTRTGATKVYVNEEELGKLELYQKDSEGKISAQAISGETLAKAIADLKTQLINAQPVDDKSAIIYDGGLCVYYVPVEHLAATSTQNEAVEGYYGMVRNHWYKLSISKFERVGHGIWNPGNHEEILKPEGPEDPLYYLGARINILSWKIVSQSGIVL